VHQSKNSTNAMSKVIKIKRGLDIKLKGKAENLMVDSAPSQQYAVKPPDFTGLSPKLLVKPDEKVKVGTPLFFDKYRPEIKWVSPVSGTVKAVNRGERRRILEVVLEAGSDEQFEMLRKADPSDLTPEEVRQQVLDSGLWPAIIQRPYGVVANPGDHPRDVYISGFDSAPLAPDFGFILKDETASFATGVKALQRMTGVKVHLGLKGGEAVPSVFANLSGVEYHFFQGPHPAGNVGVQLHHVAPVNKGEVVWTITPQFVSLIGKTFLEGRYNPSWIVAMAGSRVKSPRYVKTKLGASIGSLISNNLHDPKGNNRIISGNVLTGTRVEASNYLSFYDSLLTIIPEGDHYELFGWATPGFGKYSNTRAFFNWLTPSKEFDLDSNLNGGHRAFVMTGQYDKVLPMDILPVQLLKSILVDDIDKMEQLGIYEVVEEDFALCEFVCTSKTEVQTILRRGLDLIRKEMS